MDGPFLRSQWNQNSRPLRSPTFRGMPVEPVQRKSKVVSIPVHFVGTETARSASAIKIQKVFRGFLVRKSVKKIASLRNEVEEIERRISQRETMELIRRDAKEQLRMSETLMALLFKLDSVRGIDTAVRDCRKSVIKKVIALQERLDTIAAGDQIADEDDQALEIDDSAERHIIEHEEGKSSCVEDSGSVLIGQNQASYINPSLQFLVDSDDATLKTLEIEVPDAEGAADVAYDGNFSVKALDENREMHCPNAPSHDSDEHDVIPNIKDDGFVESSPDVGEKIDVTEVRVDSEVKADEENCVVKQIVEDQYASLPASECVETDPTVFSANPQVSIDVVEENTWERQEDGSLKESVGRRLKDDQKYNTELLERMVGDNEKMMSLMTQLFERNEVQTRMLSSLTQRVEQLERAFVCDRLRRKKKKCMPLEESMTRNRP
ncbi:hypothetical protein U1Q18_052848 [Sarracenia purpurea var. burkii]